MQISKEIAFLYQRNGKIVNIKIHRGRNLI